MKRQNDVRQRPGRILFVCVTVALALSLFPGCRDRKGHADAARPWPQPFDIAPDTVTCRRVSAVPCPRLIDEYVDWLRSVELQADAVATDIILQIMVTPHPAQGRTAPYGGADEGRDLMRAIRLDVEGAPFPPECAEMRTAFLDVLEKAALLYGGIHRKSHEKICQDLEISQDAVRRFRTLAAALQPLPELIKPEPFPPGAEKYISQQRASYCKPTEMSPEAVAQFRKLTDAGISADDPEMFRFFEKMLSGVRQIPWKAKPFYIPERFKNTRANDGSNLYELLWILLGGDYHPFMYDAFVVWRGRTQSELFRCSNVSDIPNAAYNEVRFVAVKTIQEHLCRHPDDNWARIQKAGLLAESNIARGGRSGSGVLSDLGVMSDVLRHPDTDANSGRETP